MDLNIRRTRRLKVTQLDIPPEELSLLAQLPGDPRYDALLNVMERACISMDTAHLATPVSDPEGVLGGHCVSKAAWQFFIYMQRQVQSAYTMRTESEGQSKEPEPNPDDVFMGVEGFE